MEQQIQHVLITAIMTQQGGWKELRKALSAKGYYMSILQIRSIVMDLRKSWRLASTHFTKRAAKVSFAQLRLETLDICPFYCGLYNLDKNKWLQDLLRENVGQKMRKPRIQTKSLEKSKANVKTESLDRVKESSQHIDTLVKTKAQRNKLSSPIESDVVGVHPRHRPRKRRIILSDTDDDENDHSHYNVKGDPTSSEQGHVKDKVNHKDSHKVDRNSYADIDMDKPSCNCLPAKVRRKQHMFKPT